MKRSLFQIYYSVEIIDKKSLKNVRKKVKIVKKIPFPGIFQKKLSSLFYRTFYCGWIWTIQNLNF